MTHPIRSRTRRLLHSAVTQTPMITAVALLAAAVAARAQPITGNAAIEELRKRDPSGANDQKVIDGFLNGEIAALGRAADPAAGADAFRDALRRLRDAPDSSIGFKDALADRFSRIAKAELDKKQALSRPVADTIVRELNDMRDTRAAPALVAGLSYPAAGTRYLAARGLRMIRDSVAAGERAAFIQPLRQAGIQETNGVVVERIYGALAFPNPPAEALDAVIDILKARVDAYRNGGVLPDEAEAAAIEYLAGVQLPAPQGQALVRRLAPLLRLDVERYARGGLSYDESNAIARRIDDTESLLEKITGFDVGGRIREKMQDGGVGATTEMQLLLIEWVGSPQQDGKLTQNPWNVPRGAP